jgi:hypothetical protein
MPFRLLTLLAVTLLFGCRTAPDTFRYSGGDGATVDRAVMIDSASTMSDVLRAEDHWIRRHFGAAVIQQRVLASDPLTSNRPNPCDCVEFTTTDGKTRTVYFEYPYTCVPVAMPVPKGSK